MFRDEKPENCRAEARLEKFNIKLPVSGVKRRKRQSISLGDKERVDRMQGNPGGKRPRLRKEVFYRLNEN